MPSDQSGIFRPAGGTEHSWCKAVPGGTGIATLAILTSSKLPSSPTYLPLLEKSLRNLQNSHPILKTRLQYYTPKSTFSFATSPTPFVKVKAFNLSSTLKITSSSSTSSYTISHLQALLEHELNLNTWANINNNNNATMKPYDMFFATVYELPDSKQVVVLRLHVAACDRTTAVSLLNELLVLMGEDRKGGGDVAEMEVGEDHDEMVGLGIEELIPNGKAKKSLWVRGVDMLSYSMNSFRLSHLPFKDARSPRSSQVVRLQLDRTQTQRIVSGCDLRGIKLCGVLAAAGLMVANTSKYLGGKQQKYGIVTLTDCRSILKPSLSDNHFGFYHSAILNTHSIKGGEQLWDVAQRCYKTFASSKEGNKHFTDMADLNFLMCRAIENPSLTSSGSLRTSLMSVFEDTVVDNSNDSKAKIGLVDYMGCASVHGIGPSVAVFDTVRDGCLDCVCVYPSPLHTREQMVEFVANMKNFLVNYN